MCVGIGVYWLHKSASCMRKVLIESECRVKTRCFCCSFCLGIFLCDVGDWWMKELYMFIVMKSQIQIASTVMVPAWGRMIGSVAGGGWKECHVVDECMQIASLFLYNFIKVVNFVWDFCQLDKNSGYLDAGWLGVYCVCMMNWKAVA